ncbi:hypothetical protein [uncultured Clostridium sp.]|uniref:hypothetical protein n=1 Tax=uncultured Clostridium sp. TaxID=59620 RepID=UPI0025F30B5D|nr:hypothetical protein [uncultured Clostridium sp.]
MKFNINEIITIIMEEVRVEENRKIYGIDDEGDYPKHIYDKFEKMQEEDFEEFMSIIEKISGNIMEIKSGELNELNKCHEEIIYMAEEYLYKFLEE